MIWFCLLSFSCIVCVCCAFLIIPIFSGFSLQIFSSILQIAFTSLHCFLCCANPFSLKYLICHDVCERKSHIHFSHLCIWVLFLRHSQLSTTQHWVCSSLKSPWYQVPRSDLQLFKFFFMFFCENWPYFLCEPALFSQLRKIWYTKDSLSSLPFQRTEQNKLGQIAYRRTYTLSALFSNKEIWIKYKVMFKEETWWKNRKW